MDPIFIELLKLMPQVGILLYFINYFQKEIKIKDEEMKKLNEQLRESEKESIQTLTKLITVISDLKELIKEKLTDGKR